MSKLEDCPEYIGWQGEWKCRKAHCEPGLGCALELERIERARGEPDFQEEYNREIDRPEFGT